MKVSKIFSDYAVFQRNKPIRIWGEGEGVVSATLNGHTVYTACREGLWKLSLPPMPAGGPYDLVLKDSKEQIVLSQICIGEVWLAAGQSNMEHITMLTYDGLEDAEKLGNNSNIRFFTVPRKTRSTETEISWHFDAAKPIDTPWQVCTPELARGFSAIGFRFADYLQKDKNIPVGIISVNYGGTPAESWICEGAFFSEPKFDNLKNRYFDILRNIDLNQYTETVDGYQKECDELLKEVSALKLVNEMGLERLAREFPVKLPEEPPFGPYSSRWPGVLFEYMIKPICPYTVNGVLWYQGESNVNNRQYYFELFSKMIDCWRNAFEDELPFFTVQIAPFGYAFTEGCTQLVAQQIKASEELQGVYFVTSNDIGENDNIHPLNKKCISERLFLAVKKEIFQEDIEYCGPIFKEAVIKEKNIVKVRFNHEKSGLFCDGDIKNLYLKEKDGKYELANSKIVGDELLVWSDNVTCPTEIKMAFDNTDVINLYNNEGFVAAPFYSEIK